MGTHPAFEGSSQLDGVVTIEQPVPITPLESQPEQEAIGSDQENVDTNRRRCRSTNLVVGLRRRRRDVHLTARDKVWSLCYLLWMFTLVCMMVVEILFDDIVSLC
jgi:hypothetical protein